MSTNEQSPNEELTTEERWNGAARRVIEVYGECLMMGDHGERSWNLLSPYLFNLRSIQYELEQELKEEL